jgi:hypothetical protein
MKPALVPLHIRRLAHERDFEVIDVEYARASEVELPLGALHFETARIDLGNASHAPVIDAENRQSTFELVHISQCTPLRRGMTQAGLLLDKLYQ